MSIKKFDKRIRYWMSKGCDYPEAVRWVLFELKRR